MPVELKVLNGHENVGATCTKGSIGDTTPIFRKCSYLRLSRRNIRYHVHKKHVVRCFVEGYGLFRHPNALHSKLKTLNPKPQHPRRASGSNAEAWKHGGGESGAHGDSEQSTPDLRPLNPANPKPSTPPTPTADPSQNPEPQQASKCRSQGFRLERVNPQNPKH